MINCIYVILFCLKGSNWSNIGFYPYIFYFYVCRFQSSCKKLTFWSQTAENQNILTTLIFWTNSTTGFWGKEAWRPTSKWNTRFFFAFSKRTQLWLLTLGLKEMGKFLWEGRNFPISFKPKVAIAKFIGKMQKKSLVLWKLGWTPCLFSS